MREPDRAPVAGARTIDYGACAKREVSPVRAWPSSMDPAPRRGLAVWVTAAVLVSTLGIGLVAGAAAAPARAGALPGSPAYLTLTNGLVSVAFAGPQPSVSLNATTNPVVVSQTLRGLAEVTGSGQIVAYADFVGPELVWNLTRSTSPNATTVRCSAAVPAYSATGDWESGDGSSQNASMGSVNVSVTYTLNDSSGPSPRTLSFTLNVSGWPWGESNDSLGLDVRTNATGATGLWTPTAPNALSMLGNGAATRYSTFAWGGSAVARYGSGQEDDSPVSAYHNISSSGLDSLVRLGFTAVPGGYASLGFDPWLSLFSVLPGVPVPAWVFGPASLATIGSGAALTIGLAVVAVRRRRSVGEGL